MVDPNVLEANGIDSKIYSGYALGMGVERITNLKPSNVLRKRHALLERIRSGLLKELKVKS